MINIARMQAYAQKHGVFLNSSQLNKLDLYAQMLVKWNEKMNLTAITQPEDIEIKHFLDSMLAMHYISDNSKIIDIGTGAGFPGIVLKIANESLDLTLLDSLEKRLGFLKNVIDQTSLDAKFVHLRAEEAGKLEEYREEYDVAIARAVAPLNVLAEYCIPVVKLGGKFIAMKGKSALDEVSDAENAITLLGGEIESINDFKLPNGDERKIILIKKRSNTSNKYPRKSNIIKNKPL